MNQTKLESAIEVFANYASGFLLAWSVYTYLVIPSPSLQQSAFWVTSLFTLVSVVRTYLWRRFFNAGLHTAVHKLVKRVKRLLHRHDWYYMEWDEWQKMGGIGTPNNVCTKCGERRFWCDT